MIHWAITVLTSMMPAANLRIPEAGLVALTSHSLVTT